MYAVTKNGARHNYVNGIGMFIKRMAQILGLVSDAGIIKLYFGDYITSKA